MDRIADGGVLIGTLKLTKVGCDWGGLVMTGGGGGISLFLGLRETESEPRARLASDIGQWFTPGSRCNFGSRWNLNSLIGG